MLLICQLNLVYFSYLSRYVSVLFFVMAALILFKEAYQKLRERFLLHRESVDGFFLLAADEQSPDHVQYFPLYYRTAIGRAASSDIKIKGRGVKRHHAEIYLYSGKWYLAKDQEGARIILNGRVLEQKMRLRHQDRLLLGQREFCFIDEQKASGKKRSSYVDLRQREALLARPQTGTSKLPQVFMVLFLLLSLWQIYLILPTSLDLLRLPFILVSLAFFVLLLSSTLLWPRIFTNFDSLTFLSLALIMSEGFIMQMRLSLLNRSMPLSPAWNEKIWLEFLHKDLLKQAIFPILGLIVMPLLILLLSKTRLLEKLAPLCIIITPALYLISLVFAQDTAGTGARLWIMLPGGISFQPSEFAKISYIFVLTWTFKRKLKFQRQLLFFIWAFFNFLLILLLPDFGSLMILLPLTLVIYLVMSSEYLKTILLLGAGSGIFYVAYRFLPYVKARIYGWLSLWQESNPQNDQIINGLIAIGRGGLMGLGLGQAEPRAIPLASSDMIFAFLTEEQGILLALALVICFMTVWLRGAEQFMITRDSFTAALILAISSYFFIEASVVIAGSSGLIPLTGATLPFIARGGSSMLAKYILAGILMGLANRECHTGKSV